VSIAAYNRGSRAIRESIDRREGKVKVGRYCGGAMGNGPGKDFVRCNRCGNIDYEKYEGDRCGRIIA